jgi:hypothetical protein
MLHDFKSKLLIQPWRWILETYKGTLILATIGWISKDIFPALSYTSDRSHCTRCLVGGPWNLYFFCFSMSFFFLVEFVLEPCLWDLYIIWAREMLQLHSLCLINDRTHLSIAILTLNSQFLFPLFYEIYKFQGKWPLIREETINMRGSPMLKVTLIRSYYFIFDKLGDI